MKNEVGLKFISMELGVSITTVSRALRDCDDISEETKAKVREKAVELKYSPNVLARSLVTGKSNFICIIVDSIKSPFFTMVVDLLANKFIQKGYNILLLPTANRFLERNNIKEAAGSGAAAIISFIVPHKDAVEYAILLKKPLLLFGRSTSEKLLNKIYTDDVYGGELAAIKLIKELGHKKLMYIGAPIHEVNIYRQNGFINKAKELGVEDIKIANTDEEVFENIKNGYKGIFCFDDQLVMGVLANVGRNEVDIVGYNGIYENFALKYFFPFPSIFPDYNKMTDDTVEIILDQLNQDGELNYVDRKYEVKLV